jgi:hypothetical protein
MSKKKIERRCLVIDACIVEAAGTVGSGYVTGARCREFLSAVRNLCHRIAWSEAIEAEWNKHQRAFAAQWLVSMRKLRKLRPVREETLEELREAIEEHSKDRNVVNWMLKDAHLFEAALATDLRIASGDENARGHFTRLAATFAPLRQIMWVNPVTEGEKAVKWLEGGAPAKRSRQLKR